MSNNDDERSMTHAIELARAADYRTSPNPMVGAVVLDSAGNFAGEGFHAAKGSPHAEELALAAAGRKAEGGTIYVNLEPCTHSHRPTPCAEAIVAAGVERVVVAMRDPDERVRGAGIQRLESAGLRVDVGTCAAAAERLNEFYVVHRTTGRPFVSLKFAMSLDGKIATRTGQSRWITGEQSRNHGHQLRHMHDAILVGVNTVIKDDPQLTTRINGNPGARQPLRVVLDTHLRTPKTARVLGERTLIATASAGEMECAEVLRLPPGPDGRVPIEALLDELGQRGILSLLVEGGAQTHAAFLAAGLVNKVYAYIAPILVGGIEAPGPIAGAGVEGLSDALRLNDTSVASFGDDILFSGYVDVHRDR
jgi:diaminohydroxyphosphoribosylaminopyrimidine deaminase / 5-amino-6-(5-phosphoribosylamino)uracil reductase